MTLGEKISLLRKMNNKTQEDLANDLEVSRQAIQKWESNSNYPSVAKLKDIALYFNVTVDFLINDNQEINKKYINESLETKTLDDSDESVESSNNLPLTTSEIVEPQKQDITPIKEPEQPKMVKIRSKSKFGFIRFLIILGMIFNFYMIFPVFVGLYALKQLDLATKKSDISTASILVLLFCNMVAGIFMFCEKSSNFEDKYVTEDEYKRIKEQERIDYREKLNRKYERDDRRAKAFNEFLGVLPRWLLLFLIIGVIVVIILTPILFVPMGRYNKGCDYIDAGDYEKAYEILSKTDYHDSEYLMRKTKAVMDYENGEISLEELVINDCGSLEFYVNGKWKRTLSCLNFSETYEQTLNSVKIYDIYYEFDHWEFNKIKVSSYSGISVYYDAVLLGKKYNITYDMYGGVNNPDNPDYYRYNEVLTLKEPSKQGYDFSGWTIKQNYSTKNTNIIEKATTGDITAIANWTPTNYTITYDLNGGTVSNKTTYDIETTTFTLNNPIKNGYVFSGWTGTGLDESIQTVNVLKGSYGNRAYTANWTPTNYTITYNNVF